MILSNVFVGTTANDSTGETLRAAFETINLNFANITAAGNAVTGVTNVAGRTGNVVLAVNDVAGAASVAYVAAFTMSTPGDWLVPVSTLQAALDQLAHRLTQSGH